MKQATKWVIFITIITIIVLFVVARCGWIGFMLMSVAEAILIPYHNV